MEPYEKEDNDLAGSSFTGGPNSWDEAIDYQRQNELHSRQNEGRQMFDANDELEKRLVNDRQQKRLQQIRTGAYIQSATARDGMFDPDMIPEMQRQLGDPTFAGAYMRNRGQANEEYVMLSNTGKTARDLSPQLYAQFMMNNGTFSDKQNGMNYRLLDNGMVCTEQVIPDAQRMQLYQEAGLGDRTLEDQTRIYNRMLKTSTPETLSQQGVRDPNAGVRVVGSTNISGNLTNRLLGRPNPRGNIHSFSADGRGNFSGADYDWQTGVTAPRADLEANSADAKNQWRMLSSGTKDVKGENTVEKARWENKDTGEVIELDPGVSPQQATVEKSRKGDKYEIEQLRQLGMTDREKMRSEGKRQSLDLRNKELEERIQKRLSEAKTEEEKRKILKEAKDEEIRQSREELEAKWAKLGLDSGVSAVRKKASEKVSDKLDGVQPVSDDKGTIKTGDNNTDVEFKQLSRDEFAELAKTNPEKARAYLAELKKRKSSK